MLIPLLLLLKLGFSLLSLFSCFLCSFPFLRHPSSSLIHSPFFWFPFFFFFFPREEVVREKFVLSCSCSPEKKKKWRRRQCMKHGNQEVYHENEDRCVRESPRLCIFMHGWPVFDSIRPVDHHHHCIPFHSLSDWVSFSALFMCVSFAVHHYHRVLSLSLSLSTFSFPEETSIWLEFRCSSHSLIVAVMQDCLMIQATTTKDRGRRLDTPCTLSSSLSLLLFVAKFFAFAVFLSSSFLSCPSWLSFCICSFLVPLGVSCILFFVSVIRTETRITQNLHKQKLSVRMLRRRLQQTNL